MAFSEECRKRVLCAAENQHLHGSCASPDGAYLLLTRSDVDLGRVANSRTSMMVVRMSDTPVVLGTRRDLDQNRHRGSDGAKVGLSLDWGWEPHWTYAEIDIDHPTIPEH